jgi:hypothetical protein
MGMGSKLLCKEQDRIFINKSSACPAAPYELCSPVCETVHLTPTSIVGGCLTSSIHSSIHQSEPVSNLCLLLGHCQQGGIVLCSLPTVVPLLSMGHGTGGMALRILLTTYWNLIQKSCSRCASVHCVAWP